MADHQIAHVYVARPGAACPRWRSCCAALPGVERVLDEAGKRELGLDHPRSGELVAIARRATAGSPTTTFSTTRARPTIARTVDIHRKPGYDPVELFVDPQLRLAEAAHRLRGWRRRSWACAT